MITLAIVDPQTIVSDLSFSLDTNQDSAHLQIAVMSFINAIVNYKAGEVYTLPSYQWYQCLSTPLLGEPRVQNAHKIRILNAGTTTYY